jgi:23S rRNA (guanine2445-N2)-methyltransferase / 23S rRNA (guanine2069-N7)-methyltransferase
MPPKQQFTATVTRGLEDALSRELQGLGVGGVKVGKGAVYFSGDIKAAYRVCLWSRIATRVLFPLVTFKAWSEGELYEGALGVDWSEHVRPDSSICVDFVGRPRWLNNSMFGAVRVKDAVVDQLRDSRGSRPSVNRDNPDLRINVHAGRDEVVISIDLSGDPLHERGAGRIEGPAPLKETLAAGLLSISNWRKLSRDGAPLVDPMCGSGMFLVEAAGIAFDRAPGLNRRHWGFARWPGHDRLAWRQMIKQARERAAAQEGRHVTIIGGDIDPVAVEAAEANLRRAGVFGKVQLRQASLEKMMPPKGKEGIVVANPPYGERLGTLDDAAEVHHALGEHLWQNYQGWTGWILTAHGPLVGKVGMKPAKRIQVYNGPIDCRWLCFPVRKRG